MNEQLEDYRAWLVNVDQKTQASLDKSLLTLSGGALGISLIFISDIIKVENVTHLPLAIYAWVSWGLSCALILLSHYFSHIAIRYTINLIDNGKIYKQRAGGVFDLVTGLMNMLAILSFLAGVVFEGFFIFTNLGGNIVL